MKKITVNVAATLFGVVVAIALATLANYLSGSATANDPFSGLVKISDVTMRIVGYWLVGLLFVVGSSRFKIVVVWLAAAAIVATATRVPEMECYALAAAAMGVTIYWFARFKVALAMGVGTLAWVGVRSLYLHQWTPDTTGMAAHLAWVVTPALQNFIVGVGICSEVVFAWVWLRAEPLEDAPGLPEKSGV